MLGHVRAGGPAIALYLLFSANLHAASWEVVSATGSEFKSGTALHPLYAFDDTRATLISRPVIPGDNFAPIDGEWVLATSSDPARTSGLFAFASGAPEISWDNGTINLAGMYFFGVNPLVNNGEGKYDGWVFDVHIGWSLRPSEWDFSSTSVSPQRVLTNPLVPLTDNGDGSFTASWSYANDIFSYNYPLETMTLSFQAAAVPEPSTALFFLAGIGGVFAGVRRKRLAI